MGLRVKGLYHHLPNPPYTHRQRVFNPAVSHGADGLCCRARVKVCHTHPQLTSATRWPHSAPAQTLQDHRDHVSSPYWKHIWTFTQTRTNLFIHFIWRQWVYHTMTGLTFDRLNSDLKLEYNVLFFCECDLGLS